MEYLRLGKKHGLTFKQYLEVSGYSNPATDTPGMDDSVVAERTEPDPELLVLPHNPITGKLRCIVLLVDFPDRRGAVPKQHYQDLLFSQGIYPTGSMHNYFQEISSARSTLSGWCMVGSACHGLTPITPTRSRAWARIPICATPSVWPSMP